MRGRCVRTYEALPSILPCRISDFRNTGGTPVERGVANSGNAYLLHGQRLLSEVRDTGGGIYCCLKSVRMCSASEL